MTQRSIAKWTVASCIGLMLTGVAQAASIEREAYWQFDEARTVAWEISRARTGGVAKWPNMVTPAGSATLPLPVASAPITPDGQANEQAWDAATSFPVGPVFGPWREGPMTLQVRACRDETQAHIAITAPNALTDLASLSPTSELFTADRPYRVGEGGGVPAERVGDGGRTVEISIPLPADGKPLGLSFASEVVRRPSGVMPAELRALGLTGHGGPVWLGPATIQLVPAETSATVDTPDLEPTESGVAIYTWEQGPYRLDGFTYAEPVTATIEECRTFARRTGQAETDLPAATEGREAYCQAREHRARLHLAMIDSPLLFVKRHPYFAGHIYDDYYTWRPGGGIHVRENPASLGEPTVRPIVSADTPETLGAGVYRDPDIAWDGATIVFAYKPEQNAVTSVYEVGVDGTGLTRLTESDKYHDITPAYLPDGRIVFSSTRPKALVPCFNSGVDTLHAMNADGSGIRSISSNNVTEFDPAILPDGRIVYGRWEYVDKTALYMQSLWTMFPDGTGEESLFANNLAKPTAVLDARPVPGTGLIAASLTPHNGQAAGAIGIIDPALGKNNVGAITNLTPEFPAEMDQGLTTGPSDPFPLSADDCLIANNAVGKHGIIELVDRFGRRELVHADPEISCYAPMLLKPHRAPMNVHSAEETEEPGRFVVLDIYQGLTGVERGEVKKLRLVEETARISGIPPGGRWWNQAFLVSWQGSYVIKNFLGTVPVHEDGSAYFEAPAGRAIYFEALDADGREVQRMRTFVQAQPGVTRTCIGCHERKEDAPPQTSSVPIALTQDPATPAPESWGSGYVDYPTMVQPILDRRCVSCHGGEKGIDGGIDLSGGWTWAFNISYETLLKHDLSGFLRCHNSDVSSSDILPPRTIGSGAANLGELLLTGHDQRIADLAQSERDLLMAWMDGNSNYSGTWDYTQQATVNAIMDVRGPLSAAMQSAGCTECHPAGHIGNDWVNLQKPEWSRILRAPMAKADGELGLSWCRDRKAPSGMALVDQRIMPPDRFHPLALPRLDLSGEPKPTLASTDDPNYQQMLRIIRRTAFVALSSPRVDMPGAQTVRGVCRRQRTMPLPAVPPRLDATLTSDGAVLLAWQPTADVTGLPLELHRGDDEGFTPSETTLVSDNAPFRFTDYAADSGTQHYALLAVRGTEQSAASRTSVDVPTPRAPDAPSGLRATAAPGQIILDWEPATGFGIQYRVYRSAPGGEPELMSEAPISQPTYADGTPTPGEQHAYRTQAIDRRGQESALSEPIEAAALPEIREPVFTASFSQDAGAALYPDGSADGVSRGAAKITDGFLDLRAGGHVTYPHRLEYDIGHKLSVEFWIYVDEAGDMPVMVSCGHWPVAGWFMQRLGARFRWHIGGVDCDGGTPVVGRWTHLVGTFDGSQSSIIQDGREVMRVPCSPNSVPWGGALHVGQYSGGVGPQYQVTGRMRDVSIYHRVVTPAEAKKRFGAGRNAN